MVGPNAEEPKGSFWDAIRRFFKRILFHISAFIIGAILSTHVPQIHPGEAALGVYLGLICIVARGASRKPSWIVPAVSGAGLAVLLILFGMPFPYALFWGGLQSWVQPRQRALKVMRFRSLRKNAHSSRHFLLRLIGSPAPAHHDRTSCPPGAYAQHIPVWHPPTAHGWKASPALSVLRTPGLFPIPHRVCHC